MSDTNVAPDGNYGQNPPPDGPGAVQDIAEAGAKRMTRGVLRGDKTPATALTKVTNEEDFEKVAPGTRFLDPEGNERKKPYSVKDEGDFAQVPEGAEFLDPEGNLRTKPKYEGIGFTSQTLFDMATNDKERQKALERTYPGKVRKEGDSFVIDDEGVMRKPRGMTETASGLGAGLLAAAAPTAGAVGGEIAGGLLGNVPGAIAGGAGGAVLGQTFNDGILALSGVYDRSVGEQLTETGIAGAAAVGGTVAGRVLGGAAPYIKGKAAQAAPAAVADFLGVDPAGLEMAIKLRDQGVELVPPSSWAKEAPHVHNLVEVLDRAFRTQDPLELARVKHFEGKGADILRANGIAPDGSLIAPTAKVSGREAGERLLVKTRDELAGYDARIDAEYASRREALSSGTLPGPDKESLVRMEVEARKAAQNAIDAGYKDIQQDIDGAMRIAEAGSGTGTLWQHVAQKLQAVRQGYMNRAEIMYGRATQLAGGHLPNSEGLAPLASEFLDQLPPDFANEYPSAIRKIRDLAGKANPETGEVIKPPVDPDFGTLHNLRTVLRSNADWYKLNSDYKNGAYKFFAGKIDAILNDQKAVPELKAAATALGEADKFYSENMKIFNARQLKTVMDGLRAGEPADPKKLFDAVFKEGHTDLTKKVMEMVGPQLRAGMRAADLQSMLDQSKSLLPGEVDGSKFAREVLERHRANMLHDIHGQEVGDKLLKQAQYINAIDGKLDIPARPGDSTLDIINRARSAAEAAKNGANTDPLGVLKDETKKLTAEMMKAKGGLRSALRNDRLGDILFNPTMGAAEAADKILASEDLVIAAAARFGETSPEFEMLRQTYLKRLLQSAHNNLGDKLAKISPEVQNIMFRTSKEDLLTLAKEMDFLLGGKGATGGTGQSMMAQSRIEHPFGAIPLGKGAGKIIPGMDAGGRAMLAKYYKFVTETMNRPGLLRWIQKGVKGDDAAREMTRQQVQRMMQIGGAVGAGVSEGQFATPGQPQ